MEPRREPSAPEPRAVRATVRTTSPRPAARQQSLREHNVALVARAVFDAGTPPSRATVATLTGLTRATVSTLVDRLVQTRLVRELPPATPSGAGRPAVPLVPAARTIVGLGLEVNIDHLGGRVLDLVGDVVAEHVEPADLHDSPPAATLGRLGEIARRLVADVEAQGMTVAGARLAMPGLVDVRSRRLQVAPNLGWSTLDPVPLLGLPATTDVTIANEANLAGLAQLSWPAASADEPGGATSFLYVSGDVGIGAAIVLDHELYLGRHGWSGEIGHLVVDPRGPRCRCGATGCLEQYAGKNALLRDAGLSLAAPVDELVDRYDSGDVAARGAVDAAAHALGTALAATINLLDVDTVLLGGLYTALGERLTPGIRAELDARVLAAPWSPVDVRPAPVGTYAAMTGGAHAVLRDVVDAPPTLDD